jgi:hypothetical protein
MTRSRLMSRRSWASSTSGFKGRKSQSLSLWLQARRPVNISRGGSLMFVSLLCPLTLHTDSDRSMSLTTTASPKRRHLLRNKRILLQKKAQIQQRPQPRKQKRRFSRKSKRSSAKSQHRSHSCQCSTATAHSTFSCTLMRTATFL